MIKTYPLNALIICVLIIGILLPSSLYAQSAPKNIQRHPLSKHPVNSFYDADEWPYDLDKNTLFEMEKIQPSKSRIKNGLVFDDGAFLGLDKEFIAAAIYNLPDTPAAITRTTRFEILNALLNTGVRSDLLNTYWISDAGNDLLTLRIEKLNNIGAFDDAADLYKQIPMPPYHPRLLVAGVTALLANTEVDEACIDVFAFQKNLTSFETWENLIAMCNSYYGMNKGQTAKSNSNKDIKDTSLIDLTVALQNAPASIAIPKDFSFQDISIGKLILIRNKARLTTEQRFTIDTLLYQTGYFSIDAFQSALIHYPAVPPESILNDDFTLKDNAPLFKAITYYAKHLLTSEGPTFYDIRQGIQNVLGIVPLNQSHALHPFAKLMSTINTGGLTSKDTKLYIKVLLETGYHTNTVLALLEQQHKSDAVFQQKTLPYLALAATINSHKNDKTPLKVFLNNLIEKKDASTSQKTIDFLDKEGIHAMMHQNTYEKLFDLTLERDYVMQSYDLINVLDLAIKSNNLGQVFLLISILKQSQGITDNFMYPYYAYFALDALNNKDQSRVLIISGLLKKVYN